MARQYDETIAKFQSVSCQNGNEYILASLAMFTLQTRYSFDYFYQLACEMENYGVSEIPNMANRIMSLAGTYKYDAYLPKLMPRMASNSDTVIEYPMILQRQRILRDTVLDPLGGAVELMIVGIAESNVLANAVQSHFYFAGGVSLKEWFINNTNLADWVSIFEEFDVFSTYIPNKEWTLFRIHQVRKIYDAVSIDYKPLKHPENRP